MYQNYHYFSMSLDSFIFYLSLLRNPWNIYLVMILLV